RIPRSTSCAPRVLRRSSRRTARPSMTASRKSSWRTCLSRRSSPIRRSSASRTVSAAMCSIPIRRSTPGTRRIGRQVDLTQAKPDNRGMTRFLINRLVQSAILLLGVSIVGFALMHLAPGGPLAVYTLNPTVTAQDIERIKVLFGLDQPVYVQYLKWVGGLLSGNWGYSFFGGQQVREIVLDRLPATFLLMGTSLALALLIG